jgi:hypothetical protein
MPDQKTPLNPGEWTLQEIQSELKQRFPTLEKSRKQGGSVITYLPWVNIQRVLDRYAIGWNWEITKLHTTDDRVFVVGRLTIPTKDGMVWRESSGTELLKEVNRQGEVQEISFGDPTSNAEAQAFRRAAAKFGLGLYLY